MLVMIYFLTMLSLHTVLHTVVKKHSSREHEWVDVCFILAQHTVQYI